MQIFKEAFSFLLKKKRKINPINVTCALDDLIIFPHLNEQKNCLKWKEYGETSCKTIEKVENEIIITK